MGTVGWWDVRQLSVVVCGRKHMETAVSMLSASCDYVASADLLYSYPVITFGPEQRDTLAL